MTDLDPDQGQVFDEERIRRLVDLMKEHDLCEVDLREGEQHIRLKRGPTNAPLGYPGYAPPAYAPPPFPTSPSTAPATAAAPAAPAPSGDPDSIVIIKAPMVGTFYSKPNPNASAFVRVGDHVDAETTVCVIEAMKVFNEIPAEVAGKIVAILVDDEEPIEFGKPLFKVDTRG